MGLVIEFAVALTFRMYDAMPHPHLRQIPLYVESLMVLCSIEVSAMSARGQVA